MNNLLDFAGLLLYYVVLPLLLPVQALLYALAGLWFTFVFIHRLLQALPQLMGGLRNTATKMHLPVWRRKLVKLPA